MKMAHVKTLFKGSINSILYSFDIGHVHYFEIYKLAHTHTCTKSAKSSSYFTNLLRYVSSKKSRQQICHVDEQTDTHVRTHTYLQIHITFAKSFLAICTDCYIVLKIK